MSNARNLANLLGTKTKVKDVDVDGTELILDADGDTSIEASSDDTIVIDTGGSERARIDGSGNLFVSATATSGFQSSSSNSGSIIYGAGGIASNSASNDVTAVFNRLGNDGSIIQLKKDGSTVGQINSKDGDIAVGTGDTGLRFIDGSEAITPHDVSSNSGRDNAINLGSSGARFKDVYLSGGLYVGGTGSANFLDDYEEGIHNAVTTTTNDNSTALGTTSEDALQYVKIGSMVFIHGSIAIGGASATGAIRVSLPFAPTSLSEKADVSYLNIILEGGDGSLAVRDFIGEVNGAVGAEIRVFATDQTFLQNDSANAMDASCGLGIMGFYYSS